MTAADQLATHLRTMAAKVEPSRIKDALLHAAATIPACDTERLGELDLLPFAAIPPTWDEAAIKGAVLTELSQLDEAVTNQTDPWAGSEVRTVLAAAYIAVRGAA